LFAALEKTIGKTAARTSIKDESQLTVSTPVAQSKTVFSQNLQIVRVGPFGEAPQATIRPFEHLASKSPHEDPGQRRGAQKAWAELEGFLYERWEDGSVTKTECSRKALKAGFAAYMGERQPAAGVPPNLEWTPCGAEQAAPRVADSGADAAPPPRASLLEEGAQRARELFRRALARWSR
jgi:hypothetical protein